jgi:hypothetical protein
MSKGLFIARSFRKSGHKVVGADFEPHSLPVCGRFSTSLHRFYRLPSPSAGTEAYAKKLLEIIKNENVDLWVSCSGVSSAVEDGLAADAVEEGSKCKTIQFGAALTQTLHEKYSFIEHTKALGLPIPETSLVLSVEQAMEFLNSRRQGKRYILKSVGVDDSVRADMTLLPFPSPSATHAHISKAHPDPTRPFVLQRFIRGPEYCTHALLIRGRVAAFTACKSAELLMHYEPLPLDDPIFQAMLAYTTKYAERLGQEATGHFSLDFLVDEEAGTEAEAERRIFPIECNPRAHTAVVNFGAETQGLVDAYLSVLSPASLSQAPPPVSAFASASTVRHYWVGHELVTRVCLPILAFVTGRCSFSYVLERGEEFLERGVRWRDPMFDVGDPWPAWWLYAVYWPCVFLFAVVEGRRWSRCNVSTGKVFGC